MMNSFKNQRRQIMKQCSGIGVSGFMHLDRHFVPSYLAKIRYIVTNYTLICFHQCNQSSVLEYAQEVFHWCLSIQASR